VTRLNETISSYLELEEQAAQSIFPHYFEKQKTDGVDHQVYVGGSLVEDGGFDPLYLKSLRLWQLMVVCGIAARADRLSAELPLPLQATHLVLVQHARCRSGSASTRSASMSTARTTSATKIVKKRIDKALIRGTEERVTQPGKIAIVYGQVSEGQEYRGYLEYLRHLGYITDEVEELELGDLPRRARPARAARDRGPCTSRSSPARPPSKLFAPPADGRAASAVGARCAAATGA